MKRYHYTIYSFLLFYLFRLDTFKNYVILYLQAAMRCILAETELTFKRMLSTPDARPSKDGFFI